jgi:hypothetical protein
MVGFAALEMESVISGGISFHLHAFIDMKLQSRLYAEEARMERASAAFLPCILSGVPSQFDPSESLLNTFSKPDSHSILRLSGDLVENKRPAVNVGIVRHTWHHCKSPEFFDKILCRLPE